CSIFEMRAQKISHDEWHNLTYARMPHPVKFQHSNNNLDLVKFKGRFYVACRTAPTHFASKKTRLYVISSTDMQNWDFEYDVFMETDLREPRFAVLGDSLYLYFFRGGTKMFKFEPKEILVTATNGTIGEWTKPANIGLDFYVPWRLRNENDTLYLSAYYGKNLYNANHHADLRLFTSVNGRAFLPISVEPQINIHTAEEGEFIFDKEHNLYATIRLEGSGSLICKASKDSLSKWTYKRYKHKYDSALLFDHDDDIYLVSRRNLDGEIDKSDYVYPDSNEIKSLPKSIAVTQTETNNTQPKDTTIKLKTESKEVTVTGNKNRAKRPPSRTSNLIRYSLTRKRTALFKFNKEKLDVEWLLDFPSTGDCSYPAIQKLNASDYLLMNYSSDIEKPEKNWIRGQLGKTYIYWTVLHFE
ncbi:MAG TPA: hypothetical protein VGB95_00055, partial [Chitinophagales bacterium]